MTNGDFVNALMSASKSYVPTALASIKRNDHMHDLTPSQLPTQAQAEAVVVDFINYLGGQRGLDVAMYTSDLHPQSEEVD